MVFSLATHLIYFWRYSFLRFFGFWVYRISYIYLYTSQKPARGFEAAPRSHMFDVISQTDIL